MKFGDVIWVFVVLDIFLTAVISFHIAGVL